MKRHKFQGAEAEALQQRFKHMRTSAGLSVRDMAAVLGIAPSAWHHYETGYRQPDAAVMFHVAKTFGITLDWLWLGRGHPVVGDQPTYSNALDAARTKIRTALVMQTQQPGRGRTA